MTRTVREALLAIVLMCGLVTLVAGQQTGAGPQSRPAPAAPIPAPDDDQEIEEIGAPDDDELQQLIAQAEALAGAESPASDEAIALISEELEALKAALAQKASLLDAGEDTADADLEIATRSEGLQAAIDATTDPDPDSDPASEPTASAETTSPERGTLTTKIDKYVGEALSLLGKIQELLGVRRDEAAEAEPVDAGDADPSEEVLQDVTGVVTESGEPLEGVSVTDPESGATAVTDSEGQYTLEGLPAGRSAHLVLSKSGAQVAEGKIDLAAGRGGVGDFDVKPSATSAGARSTLRVLPYVAVVRGAKAANAPKGAVRGTLRDADGRPVPRALVSLGKLARARTNSRGQYAFLNVPAGTHELKVSKPGFRVRTERIRVTATRVDATMSMKPKAIAKSGEAKPLVRAGSGIQMRGAVTSAAGPIRAAKVTLIRSGKAVSVRSGARGEFRLRDLEAGRYRVLVSKAGYQSVAESVSLESGAGEAHRYQLKKTSLRVLGASRKPDAGGPSGAVRTTASTGRVAGRVFDAATRKPVRSAVVVLQGQDPVKTNAAGAYTILSVRPARHRVAVKTNGFATASRNVSVHAGKVARLDIALSRDPSGAGSAAPVIRANPSTVLLTGRVLDAKTRRPIAGAIVAAGARRIATDRAGVFKVPDLRPGSHRIVISAGGYEAATETVTLRASDRAVHTFTLAKAAAPSRRK